MGPVESVVVRLALPHEAAVVVGDYLARLAGALPSNGRLRRGVLAEVGDGIACAVESRVAAGERPADAARAAVAELGRPEGLAAALAAELAPLNAHRTGLLLLVGGPVVGVAWIAARSPTLDWWDRAEQALRAVPGLPDCPGARGARGARRGGRGRTVVPAVAATRVGERPGGAVCRPRLCGRRRAVARRGRLDDDR